MSRSLASSNRLTRACPSRNFAGPVALANQPSRNLFQTSKDLLTCRHESWVTVCGLVIARQRPGTAKGVVFMTLEDETGTSNVVVWQKTYEANRTTVINCRLARVYGKLERKGIVTHLIAHQIDDISHKLVELAAYDLDGGKCDLPQQPATTAPTDGYVARARHPREQAKVLFESRDFH